MSNLTISHDEYPDVSPIDVFCLNYLKHFDVTLAYEQTFPNRTINRQTAYHYKSRTEVQQRLKQLASEMISDMHDEVKTILEQTKEIADFDPMDIMDIDDDGQPRLNLKKAEDKPNITKALDVKFGVGIDKDGGKHRVYTVQPKDKLAALEKLFKYYKLYNAEVNVDRTRPINVNVNFPVPGSGWQTRETGEPDIIDAEDEAV